MQDVRAITKSLLLLATLLASQAASADYVFTGLIKSLYLGPAYSGKVFIQVDGASTGTVSCDVDVNWDYAFDSSTGEGKAYLSALLSAYTAQRPVRLTSTDTCTVYPGIPNLLTIWLK